ncbi:uncharacterized protein SPPG_06829 [Spizellomyces punctatus DAOM BR117]|uniref:BZIP domain-containing protein n=1 Tax=Spizellomyces punctatus (strain DAOM BR117) TaxID=645134 RepID=A0A0L0H9G6_SPIPD|nr:uncharacterized protein SPPG_06829 [Spizellomyces punctatus DAOM BR117]KNC97832.1 hypothetical protein SPPG_06829 [Spizellomyces punctatus DAOM BR117]|eukprot:XP_016605872.1 hypothetical protein SPPG_06829 [Spizellomyces punctatus DAOM BR117]
MAAPDLGFPNDHDQHPPSSVPGDRHMPRNPFCLYPPAGAPAAEPDLAGNAHHHIHHHASHPMNVFELYHQHLYTRNALHHAPLMHPAFTADEIDHHDDGMQMRLSPISMDSGSPSSEHSNATSGHQSPVRSKGYLSNAFPSGLGLSDHQSAGSNTAQSVKTRMMRAAAKLAGTSVAAAAAASYAGSSADDQSSPDALTELTRARKNSSTKSRRSPSSSAGERKTTARRAEQNRTAQRAFRERRQRYVKDLEVKAAQADALEVRLADAESRLAEIQCIAERLAADRESWMRERELWWRERDEAVTVANTLVRELEASSKENQKFRDLVMSLSAGRKRSLTDTVDFDDLIVDAEKSQKRNKAENADADQMEEEHTSSDSEKLSKDQETDATAEKSRSSNVAHVLRTLLNAATVSPPPMAGGMAGIALAFEGNRPLFTDESAPAAESDFNMPLMMMDYNKVYAPKDSEREEVTETQA